LEDVLILIEGVHQVIPDEPLASQPVYIAPTAPPSDLQASTQFAAGTDADKLRGQYKVIGDAQNHKFGEGGVGEKPANFNLKVPQPLPSGNAGGLAAGVGQTPPANKPGQPLPSANKIPNAAVGQAPPPASTSRQPSKPQAPGQPPALPSDDVAQRPHSE
jgi:hypothetical protein